VHVRHEPRRRIITVDFELPVADMGRQEIITKDKQKRMEAKQGKTNENLKKIKEEMDEMGTEMKTNQERLEAKIKANKENVEVLQENVWTSQEDM
jgi:hypothetical protein